MWTQTARMLRTTNSRIWCDDLLTCMEQIPVSFSSQVSTFSNRISCPNRPMCTTHIYWLIFYPLSQFNFFLCPIFLQLGHLRIFKIKFCFFYLLWLFSGIPGPDLMNSYFAISWASWSRLHNSELRIRILAIFIKEWRNFLEKIQYW